jgi:hypothetical protein
VLRTIAAASIFYDSHTKTTVRDIIVNKQTTTGMDIKRDIAKGRVQSKGVRRPVGTGMTKTDRTIEFRLF